MENITNPHDLLPIKRPLEDSNSPNEVYFYNEVIQPLIKDIVQMEANGIPIDLSKVSKLEITVTEVLSEVHKKLANNDIMLDFLKSVAKQYKKDKAEELEGKKKTYKDFIKPFNSTNTVHRTYVVNHYLKDRPDLQMPQWSIKDLKRLNQILASAFIQNIIDKKDISESSLQWMQNQIDLAMIELAKDKADAYNKNKVNSKINQLQEQDLIHSFNPGSSTQKQNFFKFYGIESEKETKAGNPQWDRTELLRLQKLLGIMIDKEQDNARTMETS